MSDSIWKLYDAMLQGLPEDICVSSVTSGKFWTFAETDAGGAGLAMTTGGDTRAPMYPGGIAGMPIRSAAATSKSWNLIEAGFGIAAMNAVYNTMERMKALGCEEAYDNYCTDGLDISGKTVGLVGHLNMPEHILKNAQRVFILERHPKAGDYPDSACDYLLPLCDIVLITGSSIVNKTLPHLLKLCENALTILAGPTVPMCPELLCCGIDRLAGMVVTDCGGMREQAESGASGPPYRFGRTFLLRKD